MAEVAVIASVQETGLTASQFDTIYNVTSFGRLHDGIHRLLLPPPWKLLRALQASSVLHWPRHIHPMRGRRWCRQPTQVLPRVRLLPNWPRFQRCLPLHGLAPDRASAADRDRPCDEAVP